jgi:hypothetical protein
MSLKSLIVLLAIAVLPVLAAARDAAAQTAISPIAQSGGSTLPPPRYGRRRIEINPRPLLYRHCVDWYELQNRPSGQVLYPQMRCWWVRG